MPSTTTIPVSTQEPLRTTLNGPQNTTAGEISTHFTVSATVSQLTPNVTDGATSSPSTEVNNATTALLTTTQLPSQPTGGFSAVTTARPLINSVLSGESLIIKFSSKISLLSFSP